MELKNVLNVKLNVLLVMMIQEIVKLVLLIETVIVLTVLVNLELMILEIILDAKVVSIHVKLVQLEPVVLPVKLL